MNAPDKIYMRPEELDERSPWITEPYKDRDIVYIRKEALLEWAKGKMTIEGATEGIVGGYDLALKDLVKHIKSL